MIYLPIMIIFSFQLISLPDRLPSRVESQVLNLGSPIAGLDLVVSSVTFLTVLSVENVKNVSFLNRPFCHGTVTDVLLFLEQ